MTFIPLWKTRTGGTIDTSTMSALAKLRVAELTPYVDSLSYEAGITRKKLVDLEAAEAKARQQYEYWKTMQALAEEIDARLERGEEITDVNPATMDRPRE